ncbi:15774_t:CDS:2, partial [Acaulospora colombiana]
MTNDPVILEEGFSSKIDFLESFRDLSFWKPRVTKALERCGIDQNVEIEVVTRGQNPIPSYLPNSLLEIYNLELDGTAGLLHGDFNAENILGLFMPDGPDDYDLDEPMSGHWRAISIIDFGDAHIYGGRFLEKYNQNGGLNISTRIFARRAMWYTLLLGFEGATKYMMRCLPGIRELRSWYEVETYVWSLDNVTWEHKGDSL